MRHIVQTIWKGIVVSRAPLMVLGSAAAACMSVIGMAWLLANGNWVVLICLMLAILCLLFYWIGATNR